MPVSLLANRNAMVCAVFGVLAILAHDNWRRSNETVPDTVSHPPVCEISPKTKKNGQWKRYLTPFFRATLAPILLAASLLSAEAAMGVFAYLVAYELALGQGDWRKRLAALLPYVAVGVIWQVLWRLQGYGIDGIADTLYIDPARHPLDFLRLSVMRFPTLMEGLWGPLPSDAYLIFGPAGRLCLAAAGLLTMIVVGWMLWRILRTQAVARFYAIGMLISLVPACGMASQDRQMIFASIGAMGLIGTFLAAAWKLTFWQDCPSAFKAAVKTFAVLMVLVHGLISPAIFALTSTYAFGNPHLFSFLEQYPGMDSWTRDEDLIIVNSPAPDFMAHMVAQRDMDGDVVPRHIRTLSSAWSDVFVQRLDERTLLLRPAGGFLRDIVSLGRDSYHPMRQGQVVRLTGVTITVGPLTVDNRPAEATFRFDVPLEDPKLKWVFWDRRAFKEFTIPQVDQTLTILGIHR